MKDFILQKKNVDFEKKNMYQECSVKEVGGQNEKGRSKVVKWTNQYGINGGLRSKKDRKDE